MNYQFENRTFQVWDYTVSHGLLLIRSPGDGDQVTIDLVFYGTQFMCVPRHVGEISVQLSDGAERAVLASIWPNLAKREKDDVFVIASGNATYFVVAAGVKVTEHTNGMFWNAFGDL
jgi:hypothetical protein